MLPPRVIAWARWRSVYQPAARQAIIGRIGSRLASQEGLAMIGAPQTGPLWRNWSTRQTQNLLPARACWIESGQGHHLPPASVDLLAHFAESSHAALAATGAASDSDPAPAVQTDS